MQEPTFLILTALAAGPQHGYGIIADVLQISGEQVRLRAGTLYAALDRLQAEELIETDREEIVDGRARRYYRLTPTGTNRLSAETERLRRNVETATARLRRRPGLALWSPALRPGTAEGSAT
ncbi:PadR family transcriptional regulator [Planotetraspora thailandica]|uniref:PadR family transcriptional regulator n=2 Tax=Planotetraspora thailandica TaxID=487172 RepID=A0A8J3UYI4_9ACTN|nr:PadR family transcriptional regulator [Planotetraspora thailandica]